MISLLQANIMNSYKKGEQIWNPYGGIGTIKRWLSELGFKPRGDDIMAFSISLRACESKLLHWDSNSKSIANNLRNTVEIKHSWSPSKNGLM